MARYSDGLRHLRLRLQPGVYFRLRELALSRGASESATAGLLVAQALDASRIADRLNNDVMNQLLGIMAIDKTTEKVRAPAAMSLASPSGVAYYSSSSSATSWTMVALAKPCTTRKPTPNSSSMGRITPRTVPFSDHTSTRTGCWSQ